jgi:hypothetical protein
VKAIDLSQEKENLEIEKRVFLSASLVSLASNQRKFIKDLK